MLDWDNGEISTRNYYKIAPLFGAVVIPRHTLVARYYVIPFGVRPSVLTISDR